MQDVDYMQKAAESVKAALPDEHGFVLIVAPFNAQGGNVCRFTADVSTVGAISMLAETAHHIINHGFSHEE